MLCENYNTAGIQHAKEASKQESIKERCCMEKVED